MDLHFALDLAVYIFAAVHLAGYLGRWFRSIVWIEALDRPEGYGRGDW